MSAKTGTFELLLSDRNNKYKLYLYTVIIYHVIIFYLFRKLFSLQLYMFLCYSKYFMIVVNKIKSWKRSFLR